MKMKQTGENTQNVIFQLKRLQHEQKPQHFQSACKNDIITYDNIRKTANDKGNTIQTVDVNFSYFKENCKMIANDLRKQQVLGAEKKEVQKINFVGDLYHDRAKQCSLPLKKLKKLFWISHKEL